jgi:hypothetical protein
MKTRIEINCPNANKIYDGKGVLFKLKLGGKTFLNDGKFLVAPNSKAMWIEYNMRIVKGEMVSDILPITDEIIKSIFPASKQVIDDSKDEIVFVIVQPICISLDKKPSLS